MHSKSGYMSACCNVRKTNRAFFHALHFQCAIFVFFFTKSVYEWNEIEIDYFAFFPRSIEIMIDPIDPITATALTSKCKCKGVRVNRVNFSSFRSIEFISSLLRFVSFLRKCACWIWSVKPILPTSSGYGEPNARACRARKYNKLYISHANANHANASQSNE